MDGVGRIIITDVLRIAQVQLYGLDWILIAHFHTPGSAGVTELHGASSALRALQLTTLSAAESRAT